MPDHDTARFAPIAVVGRACVLPGALSPEALWDAVVAGTDLVTAVDDERWRIDRHHVLCDPSQDSRDRSWSDRGGYVRGFDEIFRCDGFEIPADDITQLDPVFKWTLHTAREALRDAGHLDTDHNRSGAVFGNLSFPSAAMAAFTEAVWMRAIAGDTGIDVAGARNRFTSGLPALLLERALGLGAGAHALDAACASSLYAIKLACDRLHDGTADLMLAGAVNCADDLFIHQGFTALQALSRSGRSRPFHPEADGLVPAEGCGFVALRRLEDAVRDGDTVHGILRGVGLSNDGRGKGMLVPSATGQARAMTQALDVADLEPVDISLLECHATGTQLGDATEIESSAAVYAPCVDLPIGSLKSNTGHLITAAGVAGLIKVIEAMRHEVRPPTLHADTSLDTIVDSPFRVLTAAEPWDRGDVADGVLRAGVSAFGFGGNNAHLVIEEPRTAAVLVERFRNSSDAGDVAPATTPIAIVGIGVIAASAVGREAFSEALFDDASCLDAAGHGVMADIELALTDLKFPPNDLRAALSQQLAILAVADEALADCQHLPGDSTGVYVGMGVDPNAARFGIRWRLPRLADDVGASQEWIDAARSTVAPVLDAAGVLGTMPNLVANRLNSQYDLGGASFTVSSEEHSGLDAMNLAVRALRVGDVDAAMVGAVDLSCDPVHRAASELLFDIEGQRPGDAAVMLVLKRLDDAERDGDTVYAVVAARPDDGVSASVRRGDLHFGLGESTTAVTRLFGHSHAASGLLHVAAAAVSLHHRVRPGDVPLLASNLATSVDLAEGIGPRTASVEIAAVDGLVHRSIVLAEAARHRAPSRISAPRLHVFSGADSDAVLTSLAAGDESGAGPARLVIVANDGLELATRADRARLHIESGRPGGTGVHFRRQPVVGEMAFVFTAGGAAYNGMATQLLRALPEMATPGSTEFAYGDVASWIFDADHTPDPTDYLWGTALLTQAHAQISRDLLGLRPAASIGYSSGETNSLFAFGVWNDMDAMRRDIEATRMLTTELGIEFDAVARAWGTETADWKLWNVLAPIDDLRAAIADEPRVHLTIVNTDRDAVIGGDAASCDRVVAAIGPQRCRPVGYNLACHVPEVADAFHQQWVDVHTRAVTPADGVRFYSNGARGAYAVSEASCAEVITRQAETTVDFPATIEAAYADGVRIFVEHGPAGACTNFIRQILADRDVLAVHLDRRDNDVEQLFEVAAALVAAGVVVDHGALTDRLSRPHDEITTEDRGPTLTFPSHSALAGPPLLPRTTTRRMQPAPALPSVIAEPHAVADPNPVADRCTGAEPHPVAEERPERGGPLAPHWDAAVVRQQQLIDAGAVHQQFLELHTAVHEQFLATRNDTLTLLAQLPIPTPQVASVPPAFTRPSPAPDRPDVVEPVIAKATPSGPKWNKAQLEIHSSGQISKLFGPMFAPQDEHVIQCRMPEPPLLLADRVTGLVARPGVLGTGTIWTETDVRTDSWYLNDGYMPAGFMIESGQADLMLISYMGIDLLTQGRRSYRLLGCTLTYHGDLPSPGDTLEYEIRITGHAQHGDVRLFFFEYDCLVDGEPRLTVRDAQAGFFTRNELTDALGILWTPETGRLALDADARVDPPPVVCTKSSFTHDEVVAFSEGRVSDCFGAGFEWTHTHTRTPKIQAGDQLFIDEVTTFDPAGGPWGRGFMRCEAAIANDAWFFDGHFKNDPCMPGNFMVEACIEAMSFYLAALGHTVRVDGWRFQPLPEQPFELKCRGEINPRTQRVAYELHVEELRSGPHPTIICDVVGFVDGAPAFHAHRIGVELVPSWPLTSMTDLYVGVVEPVEVATDGNGLSFDRKAMLSCAWGKPSEAFGAMYEEFDGTHRAPRLPGEPYLFISRVVQIDGDLDDCTAGMEIVCEYDIPDDAWYFDENGAETMPYAVLLEAALQPCGWVASAVGSATGADGDMLFRNLDGTATLVGELTRTAGTLTTRVKLTSVSQAGGMVVEGFDVECSLGDRVVYTMDTVFGFFPPSAFVNQVGLAVTEHDREMLALADGPMIDLTERPDALCAGTARLAGPKLLMVDRITHVADAGRAELGVVRGEKDVHITEWFFKAHFFQDPVQPGSLGIEALLQLLQYYLLDTEMDLNVADARFEPILLATPMAWKYRGQVTPNNARITTVMEITDVGVDDVGPFVIGAGSLWCDGLRIYEVENMGMRIVSGAPPVERSAADDVTLTVMTVTSASHPHLVDHSVNGTPVVPVAYAVEWFAQVAAKHRPELHLAELSDVQVLKGLVADRYAMGGFLAVDVTARTLQTTDAGTTVSLELADTLTKRLHYRCSALLTTHPTPIVAADDAVRGDSEGDPWTGDVYDGDVLFHGPAFQVIESIERVGPSGLDATLVGVAELDWPTEPWASDPALLDGGLQLGLRWTARLLGARSLPSRVGRVRLFGPPVSGRHTATLTALRATKNMVVCDVVITAPSGQITAALDGVETHLIGPPATPQQ